MNVFALVNRAARALGEGRPLLGAFVLISAGLWACQVLAGASDEEGTSRPPESGSAADLCQHAFPPAVPTTDDGPDLPPVWFAVSSLEGLPRGDGRPFGLDLDRTCTGFPILDAGQACSPSVPDEPGGIDNSSSRFFAGLPGALGRRVFDGADLALKLGQRGIFVQLSRFNGTSNDPDVEVRFSPAGPLLGNQCDGGVQGDGGPRLEGCDTWAVGVSPDAGPPPGPDAGPPVLTAAPIEGYVKDGVLVAGARSPVDLSLLVASFPLEFSGTVLMVTLKEKFGPAGSFRALDGVLAGRLAPSAAFSGLSRLDPSLCNAAVLETYKKSVCDYRDIPTTSKDDLLPQKPCGAISVGLHVEGVQARPGQGVVLPAVTACDAGVLPTCE